MTGHQSAAEPGARVDEAIDSTYRSEWARIVAGITRRYGDLGIAEEATAEAFATAAHRWRATEVPRNPAAWITTAAHRTAIDRLRKEGLRQQKHREALLLLEPPDPAREDAIEDDRLRLLFTCCHPALPMESRVALTLRIVGGLTVAEIARAFLVQDTTMGQRISRAKSKITRARIPYRVPRTEDLPARIDGVLTVLYLIFNEGYLATGPGTAPLRRDLAAESIRLARLVRDLLPADEEVAGLIALMLLTDARAAARLSSDGQLVRLDEQDRSLWDRAKVDEALQLMTGAFASLDRAGAGPGRYLLMAEINAVHIRAPRACDTDWDRIVALYELLEQIDPGPVVALSKAIAISERDDPPAALAQLDGLAGELAGFHPFHAARAELLRAADQPAEALRAFDRAITLATNTAEIAHLTRRRAQFAATTNDPESTGHRPTQGETS